MVDPSKLVFDGEKGRLFFKGDCLDVLGVCKAFCCKKIWDVNISREEFETGLYKAEIFCRTSDDKCTKEAADCLYKGYRLKKGPGGHCVYLNEKNRCSIHEKKPKVCMDFRCEEGWSLERMPSIAPAKPDGNKLFSIDAKTRKNFMKIAGNGMLFVLNPSQDLKTLFYLKEKKKLIVFHKSIDRCGASIKQYKFHYPALDDQSLLYLINLFDGKKLFSDILQIINKKYALNLVMDDLYEIACLFYYNGIIMSKSPM